MLVNSVLCVDLDKYADEYTSVDYLIVCALFAAWQPFKINKFGVIRLNKLIHHS